MQEEQAAKIGEIKKKNSKKKKNTKTTFTNTNRRSIKNPHLFEFTNHHHHFD